MAEIRSQIDIFKIQALIELNYFCIFLRIKFIQCDLGH